MENTRDALRKGSASEVIVRKLVSGAYWFGRRPARIPALAGMRVLDLPARGGNVPLQSRHSREAGESTSFTQVLSPPATWHGHPGHAEVGRRKSPNLPSASTGWEARATKHVLAVFHIGARRRAGSAEAGRSLPFRNTKSYERTQHLIENKGHEFSEPSMYLKINQLSPEIQHVIDSTQVIDSGRVRNA
jgi:hypothetical protein